MLTQKEAFGSFKFLSQNLKLGLRQVAFEKQIDVFMLEYSDL